MSAYYNEIDGYAAQWLRNLMSKGLIPDGEVDTRSIVDVRADDLRGFLQCHFFAGIGGWPLALDRGGYPRDRPVWTGSCPCQPGSGAGQQAGFQDERHLWPYWVRLIEERRPAVIFGEQVATWTAWLRLVRGDLEALGYAVGTVPIEAACAGADHLRDRFWIVADADGQAWGQKEGHAQPGARAQTIQERPAESGRCGGAIILVDGVGARLEGFSGYVAGADTGRQGAARPVAEAGVQFDYYVGADGKRRRVKSGICLVADGVPARVDKLRTLGNAIDPRPAAAFITAYMECRP